MVRYFLRYSEITQKMSLGSEGEKEVIFQMVVYTEAKGIQTKTRNSLKNLEIF
jgi:hypothetical protein